ncbi:MAG: cyanophycin synthetase, partial [Patescibacteria group bacterium]
IKADFKLKIPGEHNIKNAKAAMAVARILKISSSISLKALNNFTGTWRRFEHKGKTKNGVLIYDDYAHHPTEIKATLKAAKSFFNQSSHIYCVFQPHLFSRTKLLFNDFGKSFNDADHVIVTDIYAAREKRDKKISGRKLAEVIKKHNQNTRYINSFDLIEKFLRKNTEKSDVIITMGAGNIFKVGENLLKK